MIRFLGCTDKPCCSILNVLKFFEVDTEDILRAVSFNNLTERDRENKEECELLEW